ncbi:MAG: methylmalonyl-CoA mutase family protein [Anaerolineaceae bacterium]|nr:methylmalonyl-CoA mutase family protein [Anaerolineaceae bacterium]
MAGSSRSLQFDEFPPATHEDWHQAAASLLKTGTPESLSTATLEGLDLGPLYSAEHSAGLQHPEFLPALLPRADAGPRPWLIVQSSALANPMDVNRELLEGIRQGSNAIQLVPDRDSMSGIGVTRREDAAGSHSGNVLRSADDFALALDSLPLEKTTLLMQCGAHSLPLPALLVAALRQQAADLPDLRGAIGADPLAWLASRGDLPAPVDALYDEQAAWLRWTQECAPGIDAIFLDCCVWHEAGGHAVQEIACSLANATATLRAMLARDIGIEEVAPRVALSIAIGGDVLMELSKMRALRLLWAQMIEAFGGSPACQLPTIHACTGRRNKSALDPWNNMLRSTLEALTGAMGGCDSILLEPFDVTPGPSSDLARRHALNQQHILLHEAGLARTLDPAGGSWTLEVLTDWLAREAWSMFQDIEGRGGLLACLLNGSIQRDFARVAQQRFTRNARREDVQVGSNQFVDDRDFEAIDLPESRSDSGPASTNRRPSESDSGNLQEFPRAECSFYTMVKSAEQGAGLEELLQTMSHESVESPRTSPLNVIRLSAPWEALRANASAHQRRGSRAVRVYIALCGEAAPLHARASFVSDFFGAGGFECTVGPARVTGEEAAAAALSAGADLIVLCARDGDYSSAVPVFCKVVKRRQSDALIFLAGRPPAEVEAAWREAGIVDFVYMGADCLSINRSLQQRPGLAS